MSAITDGSPPSSGLDLELASRQLLRAIRGSRSQVAFARRLGYRGNPITDWERGERQPTAAEALRAAVLVGLPVAEAFQKFSSAEPPTVTKDDVVSLHEWLERLRGELPIVQLSERMGRSRYSVGRWLSGRTQPRLAEWLQLIDAMTDRVHDWVAALVPIEQVPSLREAHQRAEAARSIAFREPWTEAILRVLETEHYRKQPALSHELLAAWLGIGAADLERCLQGLVAAGVLREERGRYESLRALSVDTRMGRGSLRDLQHHWLSVARERALEPQPQDWFAYNLISCSEADMQAIQELLRRCYRESRAVVAASEPSQVAGLLLMSVMRWQPPGGGGQEEKDRADNAVG